MSKPAFDPNKPFEVVQGQKPKFDPNQPFEAVGEQDEPGILKQAGRAVLSGISRVGDAVQSYGAAPTRAAISSLQDDAFQPGRALSAFKNQFGEDPRLAPTGQEIAERAGVPRTSINKGLSSYTSARDGITIPLKEEDAPTLSGMAGLGVDVLADPILVLPVGAAAKSVAGGAAKSTKAVGRAATATGRALGNAGRKVTTKIGSVFTGVPEKEIETFIRKYPEVQKIIKANADDMPGAADKIREGFQSTIRMKRQQLGAKVGKAIDGLPNEKLVEVSPVLDELTKVKSRMNQTLRFEEVKQVDDLIDRVRALGGDGGKVTPREMFEIKQFLQDRGSGAFMKDGQIFMPGKDAQMAAKNASGVANDIVRKMSPSVAEANRELSRLHVMEKRLNKNLIAPGKSDSALAAAGSGVNQRNAGQLKILGELTDSNMLGEAEKFAAAKRFSSPGFTAADTTGKAVERMLKASVLGHVLGGPAGAVAAAAATSPAALKAAIQAGRIPVEGIKKLAGVSGKLTDASIGQAHRILQTEAGRKALEAVVQGAKVESINAGNAASRLNRVAESDEQKRTPAGGPDRWARSGAEKLGIDADSASRAMQSKEGKRLLIEASDLPAGSPRLKSIKDKLQKGSGAK